MDEDNDSIFEKYRPLYGRLYKNKEDQKQFTFLGILDGENDYYYTLVENESGKLTLVSCVGNLGHLYDLIGDYPKELLTYDYT